MTSSQTVMSCSITSHEFDFDLALNWTAASVHKTFGNWLKLSLSAKIHSVTCLLNGRISCERLKIKNKTEKTHTQYKSSRFYESWSNRIECKLNFLLHLYNIHNANQLNLLSSSKCNYENLSCLTMLSKHKHTVRECYLFYCIHRSIPVYIDTYWNYYDGSPCCFCLSVCILQTVRHNHYWIEPELRFVDI